MYSLSTVLSDVDIAHPQNDDIMYSLSTVLSDVDIAHPQNDDIMYSLSTVLSDVDISCVQPCASIFDSIIHNENSEDNALSESVVEFMTAESEATG